MRVVNPGYLNIFNYTGASMTQDAFLTTTGKKETNASILQKAVELSGDIGHFVGFPSVSTFYSTSLQSDYDKYRVSMPPLQNMKEAWFSMCFATPSSIATLDDIQDMYISNLRLMFKFGGLPYGMYFVADKGTGKFKYSLAKMNSDGDYAHTKCYYTPEYRANAQFTDGKEFASGYTKSDALNAKIYLEIHIKTGDDGRIDVWENNALLCSYRSPSEITGDLRNFNIIGCGINSNAYPMVHSLIAQDTARIGLERFKKLEVSPSTDQTMPQNSTTTFKLSGLSDATEFSDITSIVPVIQTTSKDANITEGTFSIDGATIGTVDISDSSGKAIASVSSTTNSVTGAPWTRDNIEGKTLSFKVNGAS